jgi:dipeptidase D
MPELDPALRGLEPAAVWEQFDAIRRIPRPSLHEERVRRHLHALARAHGWTSRQDTAGNVVVYVPGRGAGEQASPLALQGHMDMVCAKDPGVDHDFHRDPIALRRDAVTIDGDLRPVLRARGTTLGSDNGLGMASALALALDPSIDHPPLELVFTTDEETGMTGALALDAGLIHAPRLLNLDAEEHGSIYLSCAGGRELVATWELAREAPRPDEVALRISVDGLHGGHSGVDIHLGRANAVAVLATVLADEGLERERVRVGSIDGGSRPNAIPRAAQAVVWVPAASEVAVTARLRALEVTARATWAAIDPGLRLRVERVDAGECPGPLAIAASHALTSAVARLPVGPITWSSAIADLVETSNNPGTIETTEQRIRLVCMTRSSRDAALASEQEAMERVLVAGGAHVLFQGGYPGWEADVHDPLVARACAVYERTFGSRPAIKAIHAGLECGILRRRLPTVSMIAFGPEIRNAHTPDEAVVLDTVEPFFRLLVELARDLCAD